MARKNMPTTEGGADECGTAELIEDGASAEISEDLAVICVAEGWNAAVPLTKEQLRFSYYRKAFEKLKDGKQKCCWNWAAGLFSGNWLLYHKMYICLGMYSVMLYVKDFVIVLVGRAYPAFRYCYFEGSLLIKLIRFTLFLTPHVLMGMLGNYLLLKSSKRKVQKGYHLCPKYNGLNTGCVVCTNIGLLCLAIMVYTCGDMGFIDDGFCSGYTELLDLSLTLALDLISFPFIWLPIIIRDFVNIRKSKKEAISTSTKIKNV
ncbi:MAG: DUF2628 domain-containing protein [Holosporales bacterium]|jgi:hypothetical protein|nr:DUF2628 domain-containing protein [Holosporales bacterium]